MMSQANPNPDPDLHTIALLLGKISASLESIAELQYVSVIPLLLSKLSDIFETPSELRMYMLSDGQRSSREIADLLNVSHTTITNCWARWDESFNIVKQDTKKGSYRRLYSLLDLVSIFGDYSTKEPINE